VISLRRRKPTSGGAREQTRPQHPTTSVPPALQMKFLHQFEQPCLVKMQFHENDELKMILMIPDPEFGRTLATSRMKMTSQTSLAISIMTHQTQGELRHRDRGPRDRPTTRPTTEAEEMALTLYCHSSAIIATEDSAAEV
jgi:hypothetical protein